MEVKIFFVPLHSSLEGKAGVLKLVDKPDLGSGAERRMGSIPFARTKKAVSNDCFFLCFMAKEIERFYLNPQSVPDSSLLGSVETTDVVSVARNKKQWRAVFGIRSCK